MKLADMTDDQKGELAATLGSAVQQLSSASNALTGDDTGLKEEIDGTIADVNAGIQAVQGVS